MCVRLNVCLAPDRVWYCRYVLGAYPYKGSDVTRKSPPPRLWSTIRRVGLSWAWIWRPWVLFLKANWAWVEAHTVGKVLPHANTAHTMFSIKFLYNDLTTLCLNGLISWMLSWGYVTRRFPPMVGSQLLVSIADAFTPTQENSICSVGWSVSS